MVSHKGTTNKWKVTTFRLFPQNLQTSVIFTFGSRANTLLIYRYIFVPELPMLLAPLIKALFIFAFAVCTSVLNNDINSFSTRAKAVFIAMNCFCQTITYCN